MEQEQILNEHSPAEGDSSTNTVSQGSVTAHNKQKFPLMHTAGTGTRSITRTAIALFGLFVFVCCRNSGSDTIPPSNTIFGDSVTSGVLENNMSPMRAPSISALQRISSGLLGSIKWSWGIFLCLYSLPGSSRFRMYHLKLIQPYELLYFRYIHRHQSCRFGTLGTAGTH